MPPARQIEPELLDQLPADDDRAVRSRRDLALVNAVIMHAGIMARAIGANVANVPRTVVDLGAGDGTMMLRVLRKLRLPPGADVVLVDRLNIVSEKTASEVRALGCGVRTEAADVLDYLESAPPADLICINLFLHHLAEPQLRRLFELAAAKCGLLIACEPRRGAWPLFASRTLWALGCNDVTRHDAVVSVRAGFAGKELSALWPDRKGWSLKERRSRLFTHLFVARREALP